MILQIESSSDKTVKESLQSLLALYNPCWVLCIHDESVMWK